MSDTRRTARKARRVRLFWPLYSFYALAAIAVTLYLLYAPAPPEGRSMWWLFIAVPLLLPGLLVLLAVLAVTGIYPGPGTEVFAAVTILGCLGVPLVVAGIVRGWKKRR